MIDDSERREVARQLAREAQTWRETFPDSECDFSDAASMMQDLCVFIGIERNALCSEVFQRLADLIDRPTARIDVNKHGRAYCTNCGCDDWCLADGSHYCPNCGAKVVGD